MDGKVYYDYAEIQRAANAGADLVVDGLGLGERDSDLFGLVVCAMMTLLEEPEADLDKVIADNWELGPDDENPRNWWGGWS